MPTWRHLSQQSHEARTRNGPRRQVAINICQLSAKSGLGITGGAPDALMEIFQQHNDQMDALIRAGQQGFQCPATLDRFNSLPEPHAGIYPMEIPVPKILTSKSLNFEFATDLAFWLKTQRNCSHNTTMKYISNLKKNRKCLHPQGLANKRPLCSDSK